MRFHGTEITTTETAIRTAMEAVTPQRVGTVMSQISKAIESRFVYEVSASDGNESEVSKDFANVKKLHNVNYARFLVAVGVAPEFYINSPAYDADTFESKSKIPSEAKTRSLKGYKKSFETAQYFAGSGNVEAVLKTFVACCIISAQHTTVIPRDVCEKFLSSVRLSHVSDELADAIDHYQAKHMSGGASTQTSQCTLQLANMRAATVVRNGRNKDFALDVNSTVIRSFAERFGLTAQLDRAVAFRSKVDADNAELASVSSID